MLFFRFYKDTCLFSDSHMHNTSRKVMGLLYIGGYNNGIYLIQHFALCQCMFFLQKKAISVLEYIATCGITMHGIAMHVQYSSKVTSHSLDIFKCKLSTSRVRVE